MLVIFQTCCQVLMNLPERRSETFYLTNFIRVLTILVIKWNVTMRTNSCTYLYRSAWLTAFNSNIFFDDVMVALRDDDRHRVLLSVQHQWQFFLCLFLFLSLYSTDEMDVDPSSLPSHHIDSCIVQFLSNKMKNKTWQILLSCSIAMDQIRIRREMFSSWTLFG